MSLPVARLMSTIKASPILASHAPKVKSTTQMTGNGRAAVDSNRGTNSTKLREMPSKANKDINRCDCCIIKVTIITTGTH